MSQCKLFILFGKPIYDKRQSESSFLQGNSSCGRIQSPMEYVLVVLASLLLEILYFEGHPNRITDSRVTVILLNGWNFPIGGASAVEGMQLTGLPCLVFYSIVISYIYMDRKFKRPCKML